MPTATQPPSSPQAAATTHPNGHGTNGDPDGVPPRLWSRGFVALAVVHFLTVTNDNILRWLAVGVGKELAGEGQAGNVLAAGLVCLIGPFVLLASPAGFLADRFSKRQVMVWAKLAEVALVGLTVALIPAGNVYLLFGALALLGTQAALMAPSRLGAIAELVPGTRISAANAVIGMGTVAATVAGTIVGNGLAEWSRPRGTQLIWLSASVLVGVAVVGFLASLLIDRLPAARPQLRWSWNFLSQTGRDLAGLYRQRNLWRVALGIAFFWLLGALANMTVDAHATEALGVSQDKVGPLLGMLALGMGCGAAMAGVCSAGRVEVGLVPIAATGVVLSTLGLFFAGGSYGWSCVWLFALGFSAGFWDVPLSAYLQYRSPAESRGQVLATSNLLSYTAMVLAAGMFSVLQSPVQVGDAMQPWVSARGVFLFAGLMTVPVLVYAVVLLPQATIRMIVYLASLLVYRVRVYGQANLPERGGALLIANHISYLDGVMLLMASSRPIRMVIYADFTQMPGLRRLSKLFGAIPIRPGRRSIVESLRTAREAIQNGELVCIFPEGGLSRSGQLLAFRPGFTSILKDTDAPIIPIYLDELWGSIFSFSEGKFFWKRPRRWPYPISIHFGKPLPGTTDVYAVRRAVAELGTVAIERRKHRRMILPRQMLRNLRRRWRDPKIADTTGQQLTGGEVLLRTLILRRLLLREVLSDERADEPHVGVLLPPSVGAVLANAALAVCGRVAVNLNYTVSADVMNACLRQARIRHVLTSRKVMEKLGLDLEADVVYLEDFKSKVTTLDKLAAAVQGYLLPVGVLEWWLGLRRPSADDLLTLIFTSGSTGEPKGVMLSHQNVGSNIEAIDQLVRLSRADVLCGILPFFHSFGYTTTLWTILTLEPKGVYHYSPLDARQVGELCAQHGATILIGTPTFLRTYLRRVEPEQFRKLDVVIAGAEKLPKELCDAFEQKFGVRPVEGYGATELAPLTAVNIPPSRTSQDFQAMVREGTVGRPIPGVSARITDLETGAELGYDQPGMLWIKGPNVMLGYLGREDLTAQVVRDGWYMTGDVAQIDTDGFIQITGRESRFSKIGGEMVPHIKIEEELQRLLGGDEDTLRVAVAAVPDSRKGERLVVFHLPTDRKPEELCRGLAEAGLPNLWIPSPDSFLVVEEIPHLGTGKLDLRRLKQQALDRFGESAGAAPAAAPAPALEPSS